MIHTDKGFMCLDMGLIDLTSAQECSDAVTYATSLHINATYVYGGLWSGYPKGCIINDHGHMYFNSHPTGAKDSSLRIICWKGNRYF